MAEAFLNEICGNHFEARSAGLEPGKLNLLAVEAMREIGIDISHKQTQSVALTGTREERLAGTRKIRDQIRARIEMWCDEMCAVEPGR